MFRSHVLWISLKYLNHWFHHMKTSCFVRYMYHLLRYIPSLLSPCDLLCLFSFDIQLNKEQSASEKNLAIFVEINFTTEHKSFFTESRWMARIFFSGWMNYIRCTMHLFLPQQTEIFLSFLFLCMKRKYGWL